MPRLARCLLLAALLAPALLRHAPSALPRSCPPEGRGAAPRRWLGCATDPGPRRELFGDERLLLGLPLDVNRSAARELAFVPGLSRALAAEVVAERSRGGEFGSPEELLRVHGIGPRRMERARPFLVVSRSPVGVAEDAQ
jgi:competence protein ComEA